MSDSFKISVLISGGGTTLQNLIERRSVNSLEADIASVISSNQNATGNEFAVCNDIPLHVVTRSSFKSTAEYSDAIFQQCRDTNADLVVMAGFLKRVSIPADFENRVINIHPSLIPAFCGKGFYGMRVHEAVIEFGCRVSGCTVHFVDNEYDHGPIVAQRAVAVSSCDTAESLQQRVFEAECELYPVVINAIARNHVTVSGRKVAGI